MKTKQNGSFHMEAASSKEKPAQEDRDLNLLPPAEAGDSGTTRAESSSECELQALREEIQLLENKLHEAVDQVELGKREMMHACDEIEARMRRKNDKLRRTNEKLHVEIKEHQKAEERIRQQNEFLNHVLESLTHPFYVLDANDYTIKMANSAAIKGELKPGTTCYVLTHHRNSPCSGKEQIIKNNRVVGL